MLQRKIEARKLDGSGSKNLPGMNQFFRSAELRNSFRKSPTWGAAIESRSCIGSGILDGTRRHDFRKWLTFQMTFLQKMPVTFRLS